MIGKLWKPGTIAAAIVALLISVVLVPRVDAAHSAAHTHTLKANQASVTGTHSLAATFTLKSVHVENHKLVAHGNLTGTLKDANGKTRNVNQSISLPISAIHQGATSSMLRQMSTSGNRMPAGSCNILTLDIGAINLNLLGLVVQTNPIHLTITGQTGSGNLLGNLLCGVAGLLNGLNLGSLTNLLLGDIATLLNQVLAGL